MTIYWIDTGTPGLGRLGIMARPRGGEWLDDELRALRAAGVDLVVSLLTPPEVGELALEAEDALCQAHGLAFRALPIADRQVPSRFAELCELLDELAALRAASRSIAIHCRMGIGRSALVAACLLARAGMPVDEAFRRIEVARGCPVPDVPEQRRWAEQFPTCYRDYNAALE